MNEPKQRCQKCGRQVPPQDLIWYKGKKICFACFNAKLGETKKG